MQTDTSGQDPATPPDLTEREQTIRDARAALRANATSALRPRGSWRLRYAAAELREAVATIALVVGIFVGMATIFGGSIGLFLFLIRAGWRAGAGL